MYSIRVFCFVAAMLVAMPCGAITRGSEIEQVPVDRLLANLNAELEQQVAGYPEASAAAETRRRIARAHAFAYAQGGTTLAVRAGTNDVFLYQAPRLLPFPVDGGQRGDATHLTLAIQMYEQILRADPYDIRSRLGYAWVLEESGRAQDALEQYRLVVAATWPLEQDSVQILHAGDMTLFQEAALAVLRLLDSRDDRREIAELEARLATIQEIPRFVTPILVPLDASDGFDELVDEQACVAFDLDGSGLARRWSWITPRAAWLVWDPAGSGRIESGLQLFGAVSFFIFWDNGYEALAALDDDRDGGLRSEELDGLALWADADSDGISDPGEVRPVAEHGIVSIATASEAHEQGFPFNSAGIGTADGATRATYDWIASSRAPGCGASTGDPT